MITNYEPQKWFWIVGGDESRAWSSEAGAYVTEWDNRRVARIASEQQLSDLLRLYGLAVPLPTEHDFAEAIEDHVDKVAQSRGYADGVALASYVSSTDQQWASEVAVFAKWRDSVWAYAYQQLAAVQAGSRQAPSVAGLVLELPVIDWQSVPLAELQVALERIVALEQALGEFATRLNAQ